MRCFPAARFRWTCRVRAFTNGWDTRRRAHHRCRVRIKTSNDFISGVSCPAMTMPTPDQERGRIAGVYSAMSDEELGQIAESGDELSAVAQEAFHAEVARRGLHMAIAPPRGQDVLEL